MSAILKQLKDFSTIRAMQLFQLLRFAGFFLTGILLAKSPANLNTIGIYETLMFVSAATGFFWVSGILNSLLAAYSKTEEKKQGRLLFNSFVLLSIFNLVLIIILWLFRESIWQLAGHNIEEYYPQLLLLILLNNPAFTGEYILLLREKKLSLIAYGLLFFTANLLATILPFYFGGNLHDSLQGLILLAGLKLCYTIYTISGDIKLEFDLPEIKKQVYVAAPLISGLLISGSAEYIDGFLVTSNFGADAFATYRYGAREFPISLLMANAMSMALVPAIAANQQQGLQTLKSESKKLMHFFFIPVCLLILFSHKIYPFLFRPEFIASASIFNVYLLLLISRMIFPQTVVMALQENNVLLRISIVELFTNVFFSILLMHYCGIIGIAYGTVIAFSIEKAILAAYLFKKKKITPEGYTDLSTWTIYSIVMVAVYLISLQIAK